MAKKKKDDDDLNEEFGLGSSDDVNDADDNFGLPDVEYKTLDEAEDESSEEEEESNTESATAAHEEPEETEYHRETYDTDDSSGSEYEVPKSDSIVPKLILFAVILIVSAGAIWYFGFYGPAQRKAEQAQIEQQRQADEEAAAAQRRADQERMARQQAVQDSIARAQAALEEVPETGVMTTISSRTSRYYVVVGSFVDDDLAKDFADKLGQDGTNTSLIPPWGEGKFYRLAIADLGSFDEAQTKADELKPTYGEGLWVLKY